MNRHIWVNSGRLKRGHATRVVDGVELYVEVSPYSTPRTVVGRYDRKNGQFVIEFKYIDREKPSPRVLRSGGVVIREGIFSRKILSITLPIDDLPFAKIGIISLKTKIVDALNARVQGVTDPDSPDSPDILNQEVAEEILDENLGYLAGELVS